MDSEDWLTKSRWEILREIAKGEKSTTEISKKTGQSMPNISIQTKILESGGIIKKIKKKNESKKSGKPQIPYSLTQDLACLHLLKEGLAEKKVFKLKDSDPLIELALTAISLLPTDESSAVIRYAAKTNLATKAEAVGLIRTQDDEIELLVITEHLAEFRAKFSNMPLEMPDGKTKKVISWSHNKKELEEGLRRKEDYFVNLIASKQLLDRAGIIKELERI